MAALLLLAAGESGESSTQGKLGVVALVGESVELGLVCLEVVDEVHEVLGLGELVQVLCVDHVAELVLNLDHELDHVEGVEAVVGEAGFEGDLCLLGGAEVVLHEADNILLNLIVVLEDERVLLGLLAVLPERDFATLAIDGELGNLALETEAVKEHALGHGNNSAGGNASHSH